MELGSDELTQVSCAKYIYIIYNIIYTFIYHKQNIVKMADLNSIIQSSRGLLQ